jgi:hypothetical protein
MIGRFERLARAARTGGAGDEIFIHFEIGLKIEGVADVPALVASETGEEFLAERGSFLASHRFDFAVVVGVDAPSNNFEGSGGDGEQGFALEEIQEIAVENGVDLEAVTAVFDDVGIDEAGDRAFAEKGFAEALG